ncbi:FdhE protein [Amaricoccus macauensis]|uniref:FdhE protein n=1 Tax=Amaricoccus macauensis TaxID=57001 RepID=A0A840SSV3_9RHOB|nr:formate dehydrogenase accessory protein FdhE [Amaricoccus macauensis]MBB5222282.1 FdhE protein [Amaricoccus macauensis]
MADDLKTTRLGVIPEPPFVMLPDPGAVFDRRAERLRFLADGSRLGPYLGFLAQIVACQAVLVRELAPVEPLPEDAVAQAIAGAMPPIDRMGLAEAPDLDAILDRLLERVAVVPMPDAADAARRALAGADREARTDILAQVLAGEVAGEDAGPALFAAAAVQVHASRLAATLDAKHLRPVRVGLCPCCGSRPASSIVVGDKRAEGARYAACGICCTLWNEVRIKCLACGTTKGISYRATGEDAVIKAEVCDECRSWVKILYATHDTALEPIADDVASLGLDILMADSDWRRAGFDPFLTGV